MENNITNGSKLIAEYLGWKYIPFNDLQGFPKAGWYQVQPIKPDMQEVTQTSYNVGDEDNKVVKKMTIDVNPLNYNPKNGWKKNDEYYFRYFCRAHSDLRFYNSMDILLPVIKKIEKEKGFDFDFTLYNNGGSVDDGFTTVAYSFDKNKTWVQNTFDVVVKAIKYISEAHGE